MPAQNPADPFAAAHGAYRAAGWIGTLPLPYGVKWPPPRGFTGDDGAWPSPADLAAWSEEGPRNIALRLPPNVIALDVDSADAFAALAVELGPLPPTWRSVGHPSRLGHLYFRLPPGVVSGPSWSIRRSGVDLLRYGHRYSVVWPSRHPSGSTYTWFGPDGEPASIGVPAPAHLPELPAAWIDHLSGAAPATSTSPERPAREETFGTIGDEIPRGRHQEWLFLYACSLRARAVPEVEAAALVRLRAERDCRPPWAGPDDPWQAVRHAYRYPEGEPLVDHPWPAYDAAVEELARQEEAAAVEAALAFPPVDWHEVWAAPLDEEWLIPGIVPARRGVALYSAPKVGKSLLMLDAAVAVSRGTRFLGQETLGGVVLYVDHENDLRGDVRSRLQAMGHGPGDLANLRYLSMPPMSPLDGAQGAAQLLDVARREGACLVVLDTVSRTVAGEENANDTWLSFYRHTGRALKAAGIAYVRLDHSGKDDEKGMRGGSAKSGDVDIVWRMVKKTDEEFLLVCDASRLQMPAALVRIHRSTTPRLTHSISTSTVSEERMSANAAILAALDLAGVPVEAGRSKRVRDVLVLAGLRASNDRLDEILASRAENARRGLRWDPATEAFVPHADDAENA